MSIESEDPLAYFRSFSKKPVDFRKLYGHSNSDSGSYSSSTTRSESSDDFPSPDTPIKNKSYKRSENNHDELFDKVNELQRKLYELEIKNRKLKATAWIFESKIFIYNFNITKNIKITFRIINTDFMENNNIWFGIIYIV